MKKKKTPPAFLPGFLIPYLNLVWFVLAAGFWAWQQFAQTAKGSPLSWIIFLKGLLLLGEAATLYQLSGIKGFYFLGMFPLSWLAFSRFQWDLCAMAEYRYWFWLLVFLGMEILILAMPNGKKLLAPLVFLWGGLIWLFKISFLLPLVFLTAPPKRFPHAQWVRWGGFAAAVFFFLAFKGWIYLYPSWVDLYDLFIDRHFIAFFLLGWLGLAAFDAGWKGTFRHILTPIFLLTAAFFLVVKPSPAAVYEFEMFQWVLVFAAGFGWEAFRKYLIDSSWHGRLVWFALGIAFFGGVL